MAIQRIAAEEALSTLSGFDAILDARSPGEFAEDRLPGAENWWVLDDEERSEVGTEYKQIDPFEARKRGAALVARNVARHLDAHRGAISRDWKPLVYCWRGGQRSGTLAWFLDQIGVRTTVLAGGYKAFRKAVIEALEQLPGRFEWHVVCGPTGSGKTQLLRALAGRGAQVLDLEALACHRGSVLGGWPGVPQPSQKAFETRIWESLQRFDPARPVFVESESKKVGNLRVPEAMMAAMRASPKVLRIDLPDAERLRWLLHEYRFYFDDLPLFERQIGALAPLRGQAVVAQWIALARAGRWGEVYDRLMREHYDPGYGGSIRRNFIHYDSACPVPVASAEPAEFDAAAARLWPADAG